MIDWHSHILPAVDDGSKNVTESLEMLKCMGEQGVDTVVALEIAKDMGCFEKIDFVDDGRKIAANGKEVIGTTKQLGELSEQYRNIVIAIGNPQIRLLLLKKVKEVKFEIVSLISPKAYISQSAQIKEGCIIEPMTVIHSGCVISEGCIISAGAVLNHFSTCCDCVHVDCNATVEGSAFVPSGTKICSGEVYKNG